MFMLKDPVRHYSSSYSTAGSRVKRSLYIEIARYSMSDIKIVMSNEELA